ncbi:MAG: hypothetical protein ABIQ16_05895 [Polyangiaceae bacterium]
MTLLECRPQRVIARAALVLLAAALAVTSVACGDQGFFPTTVDPGPDFAVADIVFDQNYFYCKVEPVLFASSCGSGDPSKGDPSGGCHYSATAYRLTDYMPRVGDTCNGGALPGVSNFPDAAQHNYQTSQARMKRDPNLAPLLQRPTLNQFHPRKIFDISSMDADAIRQWATQFSSQ